MGRKNNCKNLGYGFMYVLFSFTTGCSTNVNTYKCGSCIVNIKRHTIKGNVSEKGILYLRRFEDRITKDSIIIGLFNNKTMVFVNRQSDTALEGFAIYEYLGSILNTDFVLICKSGYENGSYVLINTKNGNCIALWSPPIISNEKKYAVCYSASIINASVPNGIQLWRIDDKVWSKVWEVWPNNWSPEFVVWKDNTLLIKRKYSKITRKTGIILTKRTDYAKCAWYSDTINNLRLRSDVINRKP